MSTTVAAPPQTPPPKATPAAVPLPPVATPPKVVPAAVFLETGRQVYPISVEQYERMTAAGILTTMDRCELLNGLLVKKMAPNPPHAVSVALLLDVFKSRLPVGWSMRIQDPIGLDVSMPEPDVVLARGDPRVFATRHPRPADVGLVIEVADSSLAYDRGEKLRAYAANSIVEYWIVNLVDNRVEVYTQPSGPTVAPSYGSLQTFAAGQSIPLTLDGTAVGSVAVADVLP